MAVPFSRLKFYEDSGGGLEALIFFPNRYGASVYQQPDHRERDVDVYAVTVLKALKPRPKEVLGVDFDVTYDTPITDTIISANRAAVENVLGEIAALPPRSLIDRIEFDGAELDAASHWYGGQGSMLYAITSTGHLARGTWHLARGTRRPWNPDEDRPMTDDEWLASLARDLAVEAENAVQRINEMVLNKDIEEEEISEDDLDELHDDEVGLSSIAEKARRAAEELDPR